MRQARTVLSTYSADVFGVCSALYELGGMIVMHDASGCNSTYSTHDEPRWYHSDSLVFISGLTEMEAIMGDDSKVTDDMLRAIHELQPAFAVLAGTPIPMMTGFDFSSAAAQLEEKSGIPCFGFQTNGMRSYICGVSEALAAFAERMTKENVSKREKTVNILGVTPLDFSLNGTVEAMVELLSNSGFEVIGTWAMGSSLEDLYLAGEAAVNLVVSGSGMKAAKILKQKFGTPYVVGAMMGKAMTDKVVQAMRQTEADGEDCIAFSDEKVQAENDCFIIGESVLSRSLANAIYLECGIMPRVIYPLELLPQLEGILSDADIHVMEEEEIAQTCAGARLVIADPLYRPVLPKDCQFISLPHEAFSGRIARKQIPDYTKIDCKILIEKNGEKSYEKVNC